MSIYLFNKICFWCLLLLCYQLCIPVCSLSEVPKTSSVVNEIQLFKNGNKIINGDQLISQQITVSSVKTYFLISTGDFIIPFMSADICYGENQKKKEQKGVFLAQYIKTDEIKWEAQAAKEGENNKWETQLASKIKEATETFATNGFSTVVSEKYIYLFALNITKTSVSPPQEEISQEINLVISKLSAEEQNPQTKNAVLSTETLKLEDSANFIEKLKKEMSDEKTIDFFAFTTNDNKIGFIIKELFNDNKKKGVYGFFNIENTDEKPNLSFVGTTKDCPSNFFQWGEKVIMIPNECTDGDKKIKWSKDMTQWNNDVGLFYHLWGILKDMCDFTATTIDNKSVLLFTKKPAEKDQKKFNLWMSDGNRVKKLGVISDEIDENCPIRIVITNKNLFFLYQKSKSSDLANIMLARSEDYFKIITETLNTWVDTDKIILTICLNKVNKNTQCPTKFLTDGLVGFWSGNEGDSKTWKDEYLSINANVENGEKIKNEFRFGKDDAKAKWLIGNPKEDTPYNFADFGFTLIAFVTFEKLTEKNQQRSVMGVTTGEKGKNVGVFFQNENLYILDENVKSFTGNEPSKKFVDGEQYYFALVYNKGKIVVYVDWESLGNEHKFEINEESKKDLQFYFGAYTKEENTQIAAAHMTVENVFLYNRPFTDEEIKKLKANNKDDNTSSLPISDEANIYKHSGGDNSGPETPDINADKADKSENTLTTQTNTKENELLRSENSVINFNIYVNMITLFLVIVGMFTLARVYV